MTIPGLIENFRENKMSDIEYIIDNNPSAFNDKIIRDGLINFNSLTLNEKGSHFSIFVKDSSDIIGGALIWEHSDALYIDVLWCSEHYRKRGIGAKIISMIDEVAITKRIGKIFVDTHAFQALEFYQKQGFYSIGTIPGYLMGHDLIYLRKDVL